MNKKVIFLFVAMIFFFTGLGSVKAAKMYEYDLPTKLISSDGYDFTEDIKNLDEAMMQLDIPYFILLFHDGTKYTNFVVYPLKEKYLSNLKYSYSSSVTVSGYFQIGSLCGTYDTVCKGVGLSSEKFDKQLSFINKYIQGSANLFPNYENSYSIDVFSSTAYIYSSYKIPEFVNSGIYDYKFGDLLPVTAGKNFRTLKDILNTEINDNDQSHLETPTAVERINNIFDFYSAVPEKFEYSFTTYGNVPFLTALSLYGLKEENGIYHWEEIKTLHRNDFGSYVVSSGGSDNNSYNFIINKFFTEEEIEGYSKIQTIFKFNQPFYFKTKYESYFDDTYSFYNSTGNTLFDVFSTSYAFVNVTTKKTELEGNFYIVDDVGRNYKDFVVQYFDIEKLKYLDQIFLLKQNDIYSSFNFSIGTFLKKGFYIAMFDSSKQLEPYNYKVSFEKDIYYSFNNSQDNNGSIIVDGSGNISSSDIEVDPDIQDEKQSIGDKIISLVVTPIINLINSKLPILYQIPDVWAAFRESVKNPSPPEWSVNLAPIGINKVIYMNFVFFDENRETVFFIIKLSYTYITLFKCLRNLGEAFS